MRCPKCGYISFDHLEVCLKCNKDISKVSEQVEGTTYHAAPPSFLRFTQKTDRSEEGESEISFDDTDDDFEVEDPDLDILTGFDEDEEVEHEITMDNDFGGLDDLAGEESFEISMDEDDDEIGIDLGQFEDAFDEQEPALGGDDIQLDMPDELADISDLRAPADETVNGGFADEEQYDSPASETSVEDTEFDDFNLNLDLEDLGDDFTLTSPEEKKSSALEDNDIGNLSLDDLGLSDSPPKKPAPKKAAGTDSMDMDADLNFDLDLGGLSFDDE